MRKRVYIALAVLLVALAGVSAWQGRSLREPVYQGKRLSSWLQAYRLYGVAGVETWQVRIEQQMADEAVRKAGTNALPTLLRMLRAKDSALKAKLMGLAQRQHFIHVDYTPADELNYRACSAFGVLRAKAQSAVPALITIYDQNNSPSSQFYVSRALMAIGPDATRNAIPSFVRRTASPNALVRENAVMALSHVQDEPSLVVPVLVKALSDTSPNVRRVAAVGLKRIGWSGGVRQAVPALELLLSDPDGQVRRAALDALKQIDPEAAAKAGAERR